MSERDNVEAFPASKGGAVAVASAVPYRRQKWWQLGGKDVSHVSIDAGYETAPSSASSSSLEDGNKNEGVFVAPEALEVYRPVEGFEGTHRFDPSATWSYEEEEQLVKKVHGLVWTL